MRRAKPRFWMLLGWLALAPVWAWGQGASDIPPSIQSVEWKIYRSPVADAGVQPPTFDVNDPVWVPFDPQTELAREADWVALVMTVFDPDFDPNDPESGDEAFYMVNSFWLPVAGYESPEPPPIAQDLSEFFPSQRQGADGLRNPPGSATLTFPHIFQIPIFNLANQARLEGLINFDVAWDILVAWSNDQQPCTLGPRGFFGVTIDDGNSDVCNSPVSFRFFRLFAIQHPDHRPPNPAPVADAGPDRTVAAGSTIILDGSRTFDAFNVGFDPNSPNVLLKDQLVFTWEWVSGPVRADPVQDDAHDPKATVTLTQPGTYVFRLTVDDQVNALPTTDTVTITVVDSLPVNHAPSAVIVGPADPVPVGTVVTLDGSQSSDPDGDPLNFLWKQTNALGDELTLDQVRDNLQPLSAMDQPTISFQALKAGTYYFRLLVDDGAFLSTATFTVTVVEQPEGTSATSGSQTPDTGASGDQGQTGGEPSAEPSAAPTIPACGAGMLPAAILPLLLGFWRLRPH